MCAMRGCYDGVSYVCYESVCCYHRSDGRIALRHIGALECSGVYFHSLRRKNVPPLSIGLQALEHHQKTLLVP